MFAELRGHGIPPGGTLLLTCLDAIIYAFLRRQSCHFKRFTGKVVFLKELQDLIETKQKPRLWRGAFACVLLLV